MARAGVLGWQGESARINSSMPQGAGVEGPLAGSHVRWFSAGLKVALSAERCGIAFWGSLVLLFLSLHGATWGLTSLRRPVLCSWIRGI